MISLSNAAVTLRSNVPWCSLLLQIPCRRLSAQYQSIPVPESAVDKQTLDLAEMAEKKITAWRASVLMPWTQAGPDHRSEADLWFDVNSSFGIYSELDEKSLTLKLSKFNYRKMLKEMGMLDENLTAAKADQIFDSALTGKVPIIAFDEKSELVNLGNYIDGTRKTESVFMLSISLGRYKKQGTGDSVQSTPRQPGTASSASTGTALKSEAWKTAMNLVKAAAKEGGPKSVTSSVGPGRAPPSTHPTSLNLQQYHEVTRRLAIAKYVASSNPAAAWRHLMEDFMSSVASVHQKRLGRILTPAMVAQATLWQPQIAVIYQECKDMEMPKQVGMAGVRDRVEQSRQSIHTRRVSYILFSLPIRSGLCNHCFLQTFQAALLVTMGRPLAALQQFIIPTGELCGSCRVQDLSQPWAWSVHTCMCWSI